MCSLQRALLAADAVTNPITRANLGQGVYDTERERNRQSERDKPEGCSP